MRRTNLADVLHGVEQLKASNGLDIIEAHRESMERGFREGLERAARYIGAEGDFSSEVNEILANTAEEVVRLANPYAKATK